MQAIKAKTGHSQHSGKRGFIAINKKEKKNVSRYIQAKMDTKADTEVVHAVDGSEGSRFQLKKWNAVALWSWDIQVDTCAICRNHIMDLCIECQSNPACSPKDCTVAWGACNHAFHMHCISRWLKTRNVCPLDNKEWVYLRYGA